MKKILLIVVLNLFFLNGYCGAGFFGTGAGVLAYEKNGGSTLTTYTFGTDLGDCNSLTLKGAYIHTWKDGSGNHCGGDLWYRVYVKGSPSGSYTQRGLGFSANHSFTTTATPSNIVSGNSGDQRWGDVAGTVDLLNGLTRGTTYTIEFYFSSSGNASSSSGCGSTFYDNNGGSNYTFDFTPVYTNIASGATNATTSGTCDGTWADVDCWIGGSVPGATTTVVLSEDIEVSSNATINDLSITAGKALTIGSSIDLTVNGVLTLNNSIDISNGNILIGNSGSISGASATNYIKTTGTGTLTITDIPTSHSGTVVFPVGKSSSYMPVSISNSGTSDNFSVNVGNYITSNGTSGGSGVTSNAINATWNVSEGTSGGSNVALTIQWNSGDELSGFASERTSNNVYVSHYTGGAWSPATAGAVSGSDPYNLTMSGINSFSPFGVGGGGALPVSLTNFSAFLNPQNQAELTWSTASELNASHFNVHRSDNGIEKQAIGVVSAQGNSNEILAYNFVDVQPVSGQAFYFLEQVDFDGKTEWFGPVKVNNAVNNQAEAVFGVNNDIVITLNGGLEMDRLEANLFDMQGKLIKSVEFSGDQLSKTINFSNVDLPSGMYMLYLQSDKMEQAIKLAK